MAIKRNIILSDTKKRKNSVLSHWVYQKASALLLMPILCWFLFVLKDFIEKDYNNKILWIQSSPNSILILLFLLVALFHLRLGLTVVVEDYIHNVKSKNYCFAIFCSRFSL